MATRRGASGRSGKAGKQDQSKLVPPTRMTGPESATGLALATATQEIPKGKDRGSRVEIVGGPPKPDAQGPKPTGAQTEPAIFSSNGQLPHNMVPSPTGAVPVGAVATTQEDADRRLEEVANAHQEFIERKTSDISKKVPEATVNRLGRSELIAIANQRGYELSDVVGTRTTRNSFLREQAKDENLSDEE